MTDFTQAYLGSVDWVVTLMSRLTDADRRRPTPCSAYDVDALVRHVAATGERGLVTVTGGDHSAFGDLHPLPMSAAVARYAELADRLREAWPGASGTVSAPWGDVSVAEAARGFFVETVVHGWDLAEAAGQLSEAPGRLVPALTAVLEESGPVVPERLRGRAYEPPTVPDGGAGPTERLACLLGRRRSEGRSGWRRTTHDWSTSVDVDHVRAVQSDPLRYAPDATHLVLEVLAYALDEAAEGTTRRVVIRVGDGTVAVQDDGRGTDTRRDDQGRPVVKPVMATKDLRFFDADDAPALADGLARRGISVVCALSRRLVHRNLRDEGGWEQAYADGLPVGAPVEVAAGEPGTTVIFEPASGTVDVERLRGLVATLDTSAEVLVVDGPSVS